MEHFKNFKGFAIQDGCYFENFYPELPVETAYRILKNYEDKFVSIGYEIAGTGEMKNIEFTVNKENINSMDINKEVEFLYIDFLHEEIPLYVIQKLVIGTNYISQVERR